MVESKDNEVNSQFIADDHPDYKKAFAILQTLFHNSFYNQNTGDFNFTKHTAYKRTAQIIVCRYGIEALEYIEDHIIENEPLFGALCANHGLVLKFVKDNLKEIEAYKAKKKLNNKKLNNKTEVLTSSNEHVTNEILNALIPDIQENNRVIPNAFLRSSLFGIVKKGQRSLVKDKEIFSLSQYKIYFTGEELDQLDLIVWDSLVYLFKQKSNDKDKIYLSLYEILTCMGYKNDTKIRQQVKERIKRLNIANVSVISSEEDYGGNLIYDFSLDKNSDNYCLFMNRKLLNISVKSFVRHDKSWQLNSKKRRQ